MLRLGSSVTWPEALNIITGNMTMDARPLRQYFHPLEVWLRRENQNHSVGWQSDCPPSAFINRSVSRLKLKNNMMYVMVIIMTYSN